MVSEQTVVSVKLLIILAESGAAGGEAHANVDAKKSGAAAKKWYKNIFLNICEKKIPKLKNCSKKTKDCQKN